MIDELKLQEKVLQEKVDKIAVKKQINNVIEGKIHAKIFKEKEDTENKIKVFERKFNIKKEAVFSDGFFNLYYQKILRLLFYQSSCNCLIVNIYLYNICCIWHIS